MGRRPRLSAAVVCQQPPGVMSLCVIRPPRITSDPLGGGVGLLTGLGLMAIPGVGPLGSLPVSPPSPFLGGSFKFIGRATFLVSGRG